MKTFWIGIGGAVGTVARYYLDGWVQDRMGATFPFGILAVNLSGSFLMTLVMVIGLHSELLPPTARIALTTGLLGGFTTYSTFNFETLRYFQEGASGLGILNVTATLLGCLLAGLLGWTFGRLCIGV